MLCLVLEFLPGGDLFDDLAARKPPSFKASEAARITTEVLEAIAYLHSKGVAHRDLKCARPATWPELKLKCLRVV